MTRATEILNAANRAIHDRAAGRDTDDGEKTMPTVVALYNRLYGAQMSVEQGWQFMALLKLVRSSRGELRPDDYTDMAAYAALAGEAASKERSHATAVHPDGGGDENE